MGHRLGLRGKGHQHKVRWSVHVSVCVYVCLCVHVCTSMVLPFPGGPKRRMPFAGERRPVKSWPGEVGGQGKWEGRSEQEGRGGEQ